MHFANVEIDEKTGRPVVQGHLWIEQETIAPHDRLLLQLDSGQIWFSPVTGAARQANGFCQITLGGPRANFRLSFDDIYPLGLPDGEAIPMTRTFRAGTVTPPERRKSLAIAVFQSRARYVAEGLLVTIDGQMEPADDGGSDMVGFAPKLETRSSVELGNDDGARPESRGALLEIHPEKFGTAN